MGSKEMQQYRKWIALLLTVLLLLGLGLLLSAQLHECLHHDDDCLFCAFARAWRWEKRAFPGVILFFFCAAGYILRGIVRPAYFRVADTLADQKVLLLS